MTHLSLLERKEILNELIPPNDPIFVQAQWMIGNAGAYFEAIKQHDLEGIVIKDVNSRYSIAKRTNVWLKVVHYKYRKNIFIHGMRKKEFGAFLSYENGEPAGMIEIMTKEDRIKLYEHARRYKKTETEKTIVFDKPLLCEVRFRNYTRNGKLRIPTIHSWIA